MTKPLSIRGVAHPPPPRRGGRANRADLSGAEIDCTDLSGKPLLCEHDHGDRGHDYDYDYHDHCNDHHHDHD